MARPIGRRAVRAPLGRGARRAAARAGADNADPSPVRPVPRLAIDRLRSADHRKEASVGPYLPEPLVVDDPETQPEAAAELADSLTFAFLVVLDELTPVERAV